MGDATSSEPIGSSPRVFISHAGEDKERFVLGFAARLRKQGINAWVAEWEMLPGDSLVDKIFEEGIKNAQAFIVVLSEHSIHKPWVREELNVGLVNRINGTTKLIPVIIEDVDNADIPQALQSTVWERIDDLSDYDVSLQKIVNSVYGYVKKPTLGPVPPYIREIVPQVPGLTQIDVLVLKAICETSVETGSEWTGPDRFSDSTEKLGIADDLVYESIEVLAGKGYIRGDRTYGSRGLDFFKVTTLGFSTDAQSHFPKFAEIVNTTLLAIVNSEEYRDIGALANHLGQPEIVISYALDVLAGRGLTKVSRYACGGANVFDITVQGRRVARSL